ncbi:MAG: POTRA domain-containing protein [Terracidiphilus sp.]
MGEIQGSECGWRLGRFLLLACFLSLTGWGGSRADGQSNAATAAGQVETADKPDPAAQAGQADSMAAWEGLPVRSIRFAGVSPERLTTLSSQLAQSVGAPLNRENLKKSLHQLFASGLFETIAVEGEREGDGVALTFRGAARSFIGTVSVDGAKGGTVNAQLQSASQLNSGTRYTATKLSRAMEQMRAALAQNGFYSPVITPTLTARADDQLVDIAFHVVSGPQARVGAVQVTGDPEMTVEAFRSRAHLALGRHVDRESVNRALAGILKFYQSRERLEAEIKLESQEFDGKTQRVDFHFTANQGPVVRVEVTGASLGPGQIKRIIPIFEEGSVDEDLLNEGNRRLRDYFQRQGYFDARAEHQVQNPNAGQVTIYFKVTLGERRRVAGVTVAGNHYFDSSTLQKLLAVHAADSLDRHGAYSQVMVTADINALQAVYQNNGFSKVKITPEASTEAGKAEKTTNLSVVYRIEEGPQLRVGAVRLEGNEHVDAAQLMPRMNTAAGQMLSPVNLAGDRDELLTDYLSRGFDQVRVEVSQQAEPADASKVDVVFHITEGKQIFVRKVLVTGLHTTRPATVAKAITLHPGDPLDESALEQTQRNLYDFALFSEIDTAVENPTGGETSKTVLIQAQEARRWALTYGGGLEAQTGTPQNNCAGADAAGVPCSPNGKTGVSPRVLVDITRNSLFGKEQSVSLRGNYGLLEQKVDLLFQNPHFEGNRNFGLTWSGGYANSLDVSTYVASKLETGVRWTEHFNTPGSHISKANTLIYEFDFRRVKVDASSVQVFPSEIAALSTAQRVAGPALTWIRDTRDSPLDARRGTYTSFQDFLSGEGFGGQVQFNRLDVSNSSYYAFDKGRFVLARNTRYGQERAFGKLEDELIPLPERLYAGGATSLRGFGQNSAGPRDPETGFPIGGTGALIESTELRLPPPTLPWLGNSISFVVFHDMGNIFTNASDAWESALRVRQPERANCKVLADPGNYPTGYTPSGHSSTGPPGQCSFSYFSHTPGLGVRYHTPVGPVRFDFSYNLNPPLYPINTDYSIKGPSTLPGVPVYDLNPRHGEGSHFYFFFSLGQSF